MDQCCFHTMYRHQAHDSRIEQHHCCTAAQFPPHLRTKSIRIASIFHLLHGKPTDRETGHDNMPSRRLVVQWWSDIVIVLCGVYCTQTQSTQAWRAKLSWWCSGWVSRDRKVAGSTPGHGAIKSTRSTQPSIPPGYVNRVSACMAGLGGARSLVSGGR